VPAEQLVDGIRFIAQGEAHPATSALIAAWADDRRSPRYELVLHCNRSVITYSQRHSIERFDVAREER
jgi:hypothetical protein